MHASTDEQVYESAHTHTRLVAFQNISCTPPALVNNGVVHLLM